MTPLVRNFVSHDSRVITVCTFSQVAQAARGDLSLEAQWQFSLASLTRALRRPEAPEVPLRPYRRPIPRILGGS